MLMDVQDVWMDIKLTNTELAQLMIPTVPLETLMINVLAAKIVIILIQTHYVKHLLKDVTMLMENVSHVKLHSYMIQRLHHAKLTVVNNIS